MAGGVAQAQKTPACTNYSVIVALGGQLPDNYPQPQREKPTGEPAKLTPLDDPHQDPERHKPHDKGNGRPERRLILFIISFPKLCEPGQLAGLTRID